MKQGRLALLRATGVFLSFRAQSRNLLKTVIPVKAGIIKAFHRCEMTFIGYLLRYVLLDIQDISRNVLAKRMRELACRNFS
jgi:hypothetical protein